MPGPRRSQITALALAGAVIVLAPGCRSDARQREAQVRAQAQVEARFPEPEADASGLQPGYLAGPDAWAWVSVEVDALAKLAVLVPRPWVEDALAVVAAMTEAPGPPELARLQRHAGLRPGTRVSASLARLDDAVHVRVHIPGGLSPELVATLAAALDDPSGTTPCAALGPALACGGRDRYAAIVTKNDEAAIADVLIWPERPDPRDATVRGEALARARDAAAMDPDHPRARELGALRGQLVAEVDGAGLLDAVIGLEAGGTQTVEAEGQALVARLRQTERLFRGASLELELGDQLLATLRWRATSEGRAKLPELFALAEIDADVPSLAQLCEGAVACARSRGLPLPHRLRGLATGTYADSEAVLDLAQDHPLATGLSVGLETWPNAVAALTLLPERRVVDPAGNYFVQNAVGVATRVLGFGVAVHSFDPTPTWVAYARTSAADLSAIQGYLQLADVTLAPRRIPAVPGRIEAGALGRRLAPRGGGLAYVIFDPGAWGWAVLADDDERVAWLAARDRDPGAAPLVYLETSALGQLLTALGGPRLGSTFDDDERWVRAELALDGDGAPYLRVAGGRP